uniref:Major sperm protein n=1 Tax=Wuchereria bancrofti TaxID=6293 RepID=A0A1I8EHC4_WUCBA
MAQSVPPGDINTQPSSKIVFNAPYDDKHTYHIKVIHINTQAIKTTNMRRLGVDPPCGVLDPKENVLMAVSCDTFDAAREDINNDRITIEWTNTPDGAAKQNLLVLGNEFVAFVKLRAILVVLLKARSSVSIDKMDSLALGQSS